MNALHHYFNLLVLGSNPSPRTFSLELTSADVDAWLRGLDVATGTRNSMLLCVKVLFSFARERNYLPAERMTAAENLKKVKLKNDDVAVFTPAEMTKILHAAPPQLVPILAIGAFSGSLVRHPAQGGPVGQLLQLGPLRAGGDVAHRGRELTRAIRMSTGPVREHGFWRPKFDAI